VISRFVTPKRKGRRWLTALATLAVISGSFYIAGVAFAVHDEDFQLDGDVLSSTITNAGGTPQVVDWDLIFDANGDSLSLPSGFSDAGFDRDFESSLGDAGGTFITSDSSTFATGSKDTLGINGWQCNFDNNVNSKIDVMNAYAVAYENAAGDELMYFALERNTNTGDANVGFWFLQGAVGCDSTSGTADFTGAHQDGDVLVVSEFSNGGTVSTVNVYRWDGDDLTGSINPTPIGVGVDCRNPATGTGDAACAAANTANITTPWLTANFKDKVGNALRTAEFFEGGINLTDLDLGGRCFSTFIGDTRSSTSLTATLFDFAAGTTGSCESGVSTAQNWLPNDSATVTVTGTTTWAGNVTFTLYDNLTCDGNVLYTETKTPSPNVSNASPTISTNNTTAYTATADFSWKAVFTPDAESAANGVVASEHCENSSLAIDNNNP
jgi:hypothetical protein